LSEILKINPENAKERAEFLVLISDLTGVCFTTLYFRIKELKEILPEEERKHVKIGVHDACAQRIRKRMLL